MDFLGILLILGSGLSSSWLILQSLYSPGEFRLRPGGERRARYSLIVAVKDEDPEVVEGLIENLKGLDYPDYEVVIVSDDIAERFKELERLKLPEGFRLVRREEPKGRKAGALNYGVSLTSGEVLVFLDSEARVERDFLSKLSRFPWEHAVALRLKVRNVEGKLQRLYASMTDYSMEYLFLGRYLKGLPVFPNGSAFAIRREVFNAVGGWKEGRMAEDLDMGIRLFLKGYRVEYAHQVIVETLAPFTLRDLFQQIRRWAYGSGELFWSSLSMVTKGVKGLEGIIYANQWGVYSAFLLTILLVGVLEFWLRPSLVAVLVSLATYSTSLLAFSTKSRTGETDLRIPTLILVASIIGYISGMLRLKFQWKVTPKKPGGGDDLPLIVRVLAWAYYIAGLLCLTSHDLSEIIIGSLLTLVALLVSSI